MSELNGFVVDFAGVFSLSVYEKISGRWFACASYLYIYIPFFFFGGQCNK